MASAASAIADAGTRSLIDGSDFGDNVMAALPNVVGQTIGEVVAGGFSRRSPVTTSSAKVGATPKNAEEVAAACQVAPRDAWTWEEDPRSTNYVDPADRAGATPLPSDEGEIVITGQFRRSWFQRFTAAIGGFFHSLTSGPERTYNPAVLSLSHQANGAVDIWQDHGPMYYTAHPQELAAQQALYGQLRSGIASAYRQPGLSMFDVSALESVNNSLTVSAYNNGIVSFDQLRHGFNDVDFAFALGSVGLSGGGAHDLPPSVRARAGVAGLRPGTLNFEAEGDVGVYTGTIKWGIRDVNVRRAGPGFWGERQQLSNPAAEAFELQINPNGESYYLPAPGGGYRQFENLVGNTLQDGKYVGPGDAFYRVDSMPPFAAQSALSQARGQVAAASQAHLSVEWLVSDRVAAQQLHSLFGRESVPVTVRYLPVRPPAPQPQPRHP